jgi:hypothetical protein
MVGASVGIKKEDLKLAVTNNTPSTATNAPTIKAAEVHLLRVIQPPPANLSQDKPEPKKDFTAENAEPAENI